MKYFKQANIYKNSTGTNSVSLEKCEAYSYDWWQYLTKVNGLVIFNNYFYSPTTSKHQSNCRGLLHDAGIKIDLLLDFNGHFNASNWIDNAVSQYQQKIVNNVKYMNRPRVRQKTKDRLLEQNNEFFKVIALLETLKTVEAA
jgi:endo-beta-N-acetylglucosaminidase D